MLWSFFNTKKLMKVGATLNEAEVIQEIRENIIEMKVMLENISMRSDLKMETFE